MATLLLGYDVERMDPGSDVTRLFLDQATRVHDRYSAPCTLFVVGRTLENNVDAFRKAAERRDLFDIQSHTYSHRLLKTVCQDIDGQISIWRGESIPDIEIEVKRSADVTRELLGIEVKGICGPYCYYRGLSDRPDILEILHANGIRFTRTWGRNEKDWQPVELSLQPFWYEAQGFGDMLEMPIHGWQDCIWRGERGWEDTKGFADYQCELIDEAADKDSVLGLCAHDWSSIREDPELTIVSAILDHARARGLRIMSYNAYYEEALSQRAACEA